MADGQKISADDLQTRVNLTLPAYVTHDAGRGGGERWNEGVGNNPGGILSLTQDIVRFDSVVAYAGPLFGRLKNSEDTMSNFVGGVVGVR